MTQLAALKQLAEKVEAGAFPADMFASDLGMTGDGYLSGLPVMKTMYSAFSGDLNAAKALLAAVMPGWDARIFLSGSAWVYIPTRGAPPKMEAESEIKDQPARSLLLATILGKIAELEAAT